MKQRNLFTVVQPESGSWDFINLMNIEYHNDFYAKYKLNCNKNDKDYYKANHEYIRVYQYVYYHNKNMNKKNV